MVKRSINSCACICLLMHMFWIHIWTNEYQTTVLLMCMKSIIFFYTEVATTQWLFRRCAMEQYYDVMWTFYRVKVTYIAVTTYPIFTELQLWTKPDTYWSASQRIDYVSHLYPRRNVPISSCGYGTNIQYIFVLTRFTYFQMRITIVTTPPCLRT